MLSTTLVSNASSNSHHKVQVQQTKKLRKQVNENISTAFMKILRDQIIENLSVAQSVPKTAKEMCGPEFWMSIPNGEKLTAGGAIARMVRDGLLPLKIYGKNAQNALLYVLA